VIERLPRRIELPGTGKVPLVVVGGREQGEDAVVLADRHTVQFVVLGGRATEVDDVAAPAQELLDHVGRAGARLGDVVEHVRVLETTSRRGPARRMPARPAPISVGSRSSLSLAMGAVLDTGDLRIP